jgi:Flp pilus assembly protein TadD
LRRDPNDAEAHAALGRHLLVAGQVPAALSHLRRAAQLAPSVDADYQLAAALVRGGQGQEARDLLERIVARRPTHARAWQNLGVIHARQGRPSDAVAAFETSLRHDSALTDSSLNLAHTLSMQGRYADAVAVLERAVWQTPNEPRAVAALAWHLATVPVDAVRDGARAVELAEQALRLQQPPNLSMLDALAAAYAEAGRFEEAVQAGQRAVDLARTLKRRGLVQQAQARRALYSQHRPFRLSPRGAR